MEGKLKPRNYQPRIVDDLLARRLRSFGAVEVVGPKFCGKTWASMTQANSIIHVDSEPTRQILSVDSSLAFEGEVPHVIDEWQDLPQLWDATRRAVDAGANEPGRFILTGSSTVDRTKVSHSGAGRIARVRMRPLSLFESGVSNGRVSLSGLFEGTFTPCVTEIGVRELAFLVCLGGWPALLGRDVVDTAELPAQYLDSLFTVSAPRAGLDPYQTQRVAASLARNVGKPLTYKTLYADVFELDGLDSVDQSTMRQTLVPYLSFLKDQFFIEEQEGWDAPVKSRSRVRTKPRRSFCDPSLAASLLGMTPERLLGEYQVFGNLFEELCLRDLRVYASALGVQGEASVRYYSDADGLECDAIIELPDGRWAAIEIKLSDDKVPAAEKSLLRLARKVAANPAARNPKPEFMAVLVGKTPFARRTENGVYVVPITELTA